MPVRWGRVAADRHPPAVSPLASEPDRGKPPSAISGLSILHHRILRAGCSPGQRI